MKWECELLGETALTCIFFSLCEKTSSTCPFFHPLPYSRKLSPASASTLSSHPSKSSVTGHWPAEEPSPRTPCSSPREPKQPSRWQRACGVTAHTQKFMHLYKHNGIWTHRAPRSFNPDSHDICLLIADVTSLVRDVSLLKKLKIILLAVLLLEPLL